MFTGKINFSNETIREQNEAVTYVMEGPGAASKLSMRSPTIWNLK